MANVLVNVPYGKTSTGQAKVVQIPRDAFRTYQQKWKVPQRMANPARKISSFEISMAPAKTIALAALKRSVSSRNLAGLLEEKEASSSLDKVWLGPEKSVEIDLGKIKFYKIMLEDGVDPALPLEARIPAERKTFSVFLPVILYETFNSLKSEEFTIKKLAFCKKILEKFTKEVIDQYKVKTDHFIKKLNGEMAKTIYGQVEEYRLAFLLNELKDRNNTLYDLLIFLMINYTQLSDKEKQERMFAQLPGGLRNNLYIKRLFERANSVLLSLKEIQEREKTGVNKMLYHFDQILQKPKTA
jgi:hypothetical protein